MTDQPDDPGAQPAPHVIDVAQRDLRIAWDRVRAQLESKRAQRDELADEIRQLVIHESLLRQANSVFEKRKGSR